jgi:lipopolysaccharide export system permease protein
VILSTYVLREHTVPFLFSFVVIIFLLVLDLLLQMMDMILGKGVPVLAILELFALNTAWMVALAAPMAVLVATLMAFGRLSSDNEVVAMRALGVGTHQVFLPVVLAATVLGGVLVVFNDLVLPECNYRARLLMSDIRRKRPAVALSGREGLVIQDFQNYRILIERIDDRTSELQNIVIYKYEGGEDPVVITASRGEVRFPPGRDEALLTLLEGEIHRVDPEEPAVYVRATFQRQTLLLGEAGRRLARTVSRYRNDRELSTGMMRQRIREYEHDVETLRTESARRLAAELKSAFFEESDPAGVEPTRRLFSLRSQMGADATVGAHKLRQADRYRVEIHKKYAIPAACLTFVLIGAPLGILARGANPAVGAGVSIGFFLIYWLFLIGGEKLADRGFLPAWLAMWSPNILITVGGMCMCARLVFAGRTRAVGRSACAS